MLMHDVCKLSKWRIRWYHFYATKISYKCVVRCHVKLIFVCMMFVGRERWCNSWFHPLDEKNLTYFIWVCSKFSINFSSNSMCFIMNFKFFNTNTVSFSLFVVCERSSHPIGDKNLTHVMSVCSMFSTMIDSKTSCSYM